MRGIRQKKPAPLLGRTTSGGNMTFSRTDPFLIAPCSVNARGRTGENLSRRRWSQIATTSAFSANVSWKEKSPGKRPSLRLTCSLSRLVDRP
jgi:hypothetical protein